MKLCSNEHSGAVRFGYPYNCKDATGQYGLLRSDRNGVAITRCPGKFTGRKTSLRVRTNLMFKLMQVYRKGAVRAF